MKKTLINHYVQELKKTIEGENWVEENFRKKLDNLEEKKVFIRPIPAVHSVAELVSHIVVWKQEVLNRLHKNECRLSVESPENWKSNDELRLQGWDRLKLALYNSQEELIAFLNQKDDSFLIENEYANGYSFKYLVDGLLQHDMYHLGQIGITIKLLRM